MIKQKNFIIYLTLPLFFLLLLPSCNGNSVSYYQIERILAELNEGEILFDEIIIERPELFEGTLTITKKKGNIGAKIHNRTERILKITLSGNIRNQYNLIQYYLLNNSIIFAHCIFLDSSQSSYYLLENKKIYLSKRADYNKVEPIPYDPCFEILNELFIEGLRLY